MTRLEAEIIVGLAENGLNIEKVAQLMHYHRNSLCYYINKIKRETGGNPKDFYDLCDLLPIAEEILNGEPRDISNMEFVTRCQNCKYFSHEFGDVCMREEDWFYMAPDDFCSRAVRLK